MTASCGLVANSSGTWAAARRSGLSVQGLGQVELPVDQGVAFRGHISGEDADLAIGDLAGRPGVLPSNAARRRALLEEAGLVDDQHGVALGQRLERIVAHNIAQRVGIPVAAPQHRLLAPGTGIASGLRSHPPRLAPLRSEQRVQESRGRSHNTWMPDQPTQTGLRFPQFGRPELQQILNGNPRHRTLPQNSINREATSMLQL